MQALLNILLSIPNGNRTYATALLQITAAIIVLLAVLFGLLPADQSTVAVAGFAVVDGIKAIFHRAAVDEVRSSEPVVVSEPTIVGKEYPK